MALNLDDPLAGILSDGSDDSFFDDDILGKKKTPKKKTTPIAEKKSALFDFEDSEMAKPPINISENKKDAIFDLGGDTKKNLDEFKGPSNASPAPLKRTISKESFKIPLVEPKLSSMDIIKSPARTRVSASAEELVTLSEIRSDKKPSLKPLEKGKSSHSILDDILGGSSAKTAGANQTTRPTTAAKSQDFDFDSFLGKADSKAPKNAKTPLKLNVKPDSQKDEKKPKQENTKKKSSEDWLGIFQEQDESPEEDSGMPSWLVGGESKKKKEQKPKPESKEVTQVEVDREIEVPEEKEKEIRHIDNSPMVEHFLPKVAIAPSSVIQGSTDDITAEGATLYLQQQESQLMVAMQLKAQEERLAAMQTRQKESQRVQREAALAHHAQLDLMLQKQAEQRQQMQAIISAHQQRISQRIKSLLGLNVESNEDDGNVNHNNDYEPNVVTEMTETPHMKEKKQLLQLVQSLQDNHDKEIDLMESSYRRQLAFLEISLHQGEERMKDESDKLIKFYSEKIQWLEEHHQSYKKITEENLSSLTVRHKAENEMTRHQHLENIRILQEHHAALMENIRNAVKQEQALIQDSASFSSDLHELVTDVRENKVQSQLLVERVQILVENTQRDNDRSLQVRETQINEMIQQLKKEKDNFETEKVENREIVKMLETRLKQMTTMIEEESASLKQKKMEFEFEKATFSKQTEFAKNILKKQDEEIKALRDDIQKEYQDKTTRIEEERVKAHKDSSVIAKEKVSIQSLKQDLEKMKAELEAQLEEVTEERSKLNVEKQQLHMEEQRILAKSRDYDLLAKTAIDKQSQADKKYSEAEFLQRKYEERIRRIQEHVVSLNAREKQIAREKVALSRERLTLHNERKQFDSRQQCSLCKSTQNIPEYNLSYALPESFQNVPVSRDYRNVDAAMNNIERDIASLMSRNYSLRYDTEAGNSGASESKFQSVGSAPVESEAFKDLMDPKFMMLRLDVQKVLSNLGHSKNVDNIINSDDNVENRDQEKTE